jgi:hypothetical protein
VQPRNSTVLIAALVIAGGGCATTYVTPAGAENQIEPTAG